jgi:hypothetical protein
MSRRSPPSTTEFAVADHEVMRRSAAFMRSRADRSWVVHGSGCHGSPGSRSGARLTSRFLDCYRTGPQGPRPLGSRRRALSAGSCRCSRSRRNGRSRPNTRPSAGPHAKKGLQMQAFLRAAEGIRSLDLLHGKQYLGFPLAPRFRCKRARSRPSRPFQIPRLSPRNHGGLGTQEAPAPGRASAPLASVSRLRWWRPGCRAGRVPRRIGCRGRRCR